MILNRRRFLQSSFGVIGLAATGGWPKWSFAHLPTDNRFILVILRGAMDGLAAVAPYGDPHYKLARGGLALPTPDQPEGLLDLDGFFGFNPAFDALLPLYKNGQLAVLHAAASPYRERSHFDAQNVVENGTTRPGGTGGWLNRALALAEAGPQAGIALNPQTPLVLQGALPTLSWAPKNRAMGEGSDYMRAISRLYQADPLLSGPFAEAVQAETIAAASLSTDDRTASGNAKGTDQLLSAAHAAGAFLAREDGPRVAVMEAGGWDTHARQGTSSGLLFGRLSGLGKGLAALPQALGPAWNKTVVVVVTEFGRTVAQNGTGGTDHGTGGVMLVLGGRVRGGKVLGKWPGLGENQLYQGRDLLPTTDMRSVFKTVLAGHLGIAQSGLESEVFPDSYDARMLPGLLA